jgi:hypothetical protein
LVPEFVEVENAALVTAVARIGRDRLAQAAAGQGDQRRWQHGHDPS